MKFQETLLKNAYVINLSPYVDNRGYFTRMFSKDEFRNIGFNEEIVQINHAFNKDRFTFRGFHFQKPPFSETKIIRCMIGRVQDYIIDIRKGSPTFLKSFTVELSEQNNLMILVPEGFAHGYLTLTKNTRLVYIHTSLYVPGYEGGINFKDKSLNLELPHKPKIISEKDLSYPLIEDSAFEGIEVKNTNRMFGFDLEYSGEITKEF
jgi:dTDP-4-dehydrorhamnose 3,5-epimerase